MKYTEELLLKVSNEAYNQGDVKFDIIPEKCALLVIDMQEEFVKPEWTSSWIPEATHQIPKIKRLIDFCRGEKIPVIYTAFRDTYAFRDRPKYGNLMPKSYHQLGNDPSLYKEGRIWHELMPQENEIIIFKPSCGTLTNYCCSTTARQGYERGFKVIVGST
jgi:nicotinamidase-related amidase